MMTRHYYTLLPVFLVAGVSATLAQAQLKESPITPGFWSFPSHKIATAQDVVAACRNHFEIKFADGHILGLRTHETASGLVRQEVDDVGRCAFNRGAQIDHCDM